MRRIAFNSTAPFEEHLADVSNGFRQKIAPLVLRTKLDQFDEALAHLRDQVGQVDWIIPFNVLSHHLVYLTVQTGFLRHCLLHLPPEMTPGTHPRNAVQTTLAALPANISNPAQPRHATDVHLPKSVTSTAFDVRDPASLAKRRQPCSFAQKHAIIVTNSQQIRMWQ
jgi:hypothetical protein